MDFLHRRLNIPELVDLVFKFGKYDTEPYLLELEKKIVQNTNILNIKYLPDHLQERFYRNKINRQIRYDFLTNLFEKYNISYYITEKDDIIGYDYWNLERLQSFCNELSDYFDINWNTFFKDIQGIKILLYKHLSY